MSALSAAQAHLRHLATLTDVPLDPASSPALVDTSVALAAELLVAAHADQDRAEAHAKARLGRLMQDEPGRLFTVALTDQALRASRPARVARAIERLLRLYGVPRYFAAYERLALRAFRALGPLMPRLLVPKFLNRLRREVRAVVLPAEESEFAAIIRTLRASNLQVNVNHLGEAILGEDEARARLAAYAATLERSDVDGISIKISAVTSQLSLLDWDATVQSVFTRLIPLYLAAQAHGDKLVTLDMEAYREVGLTLAVFEQLLADDRLLNSRLAIVVQAYLPDAAPLQAHLLALARTRSARGGRPIRIRLVKGANLAMERVDAALHAWPLAPFATKAAVDAHYKRLVATALRPENAAVCHVAIASHNLFDLAWALTLRAALHLEGAVAFEMLYGVAPALSRVVASLSGDLMLYAPTARDDDLLAAVGYLIRRLDENTGPENFLRSSFAMTPESPSFHAEEQRFRESLHAIMPTAGPHRALGLGAKPSLLAAAPASTSIPFTNAVDTDWSLPPNRASLAEHLAATAALAPFVVTPHIAGQDLHDGPTAPGLDPSTGTARYTTVLATGDALEAALATAVRGAARWGATSLADRRQVLFTIATLLESSRIHLITIMLADSGKAPTEADPEISEAIDFARYYAASTETLAALQATHDVSPRGVVLVAPPWNFPLSIPAGGVLAALAAGDAVILKPAPETTWTARVFAELCWSAGVPGDVLQFVPCANQPDAERLVQDPRVATVILTGGTATARHLQALAPNLHLIAETGGKNALIVSELADWDHAIHIILQSSFNYAGQKCSASSLLILDATLYDDPRFLSRLADAARSLVVASAWNLGATVTPLIRPPRGLLAWNLAGGLDPGESWLVPPRAHPENPRLWGPAIKLGVTPQSQSYANELFGPVLSVLRATSFDHAIELANGVPYGLTSGLVSLDPAEIDLWHAQIDAGCLYVNRTTTGAIVERQPFGGVKASVFGPGAKAGGPNYLLQLVTVRDRVDTVAAPPDDETAWLTHFAAPPDPVRLLGQDNVLRYRAARVGLRLDAAACASDTARALQALAFVHKVAPCRGTKRLIELSISPNLLNDAAFTALLAKLPEATFAAPIVEDTPALAGRLASLQLERLRLITATTSPVPLELSQAAHQAHVFIESSPPVSSGRVELLRYLREETLSTDYHRFGNLGTREGEARRGPAPLEPSVITQESPITRL